MRNTALSLLRALASLKLTLLGIVALLMGILLAYFSAEQSSIWIMPAVSLLALNLFAAIVFNPRIRQNSGLLMFHICLLMIAVLSLLSQLTSMKGRIEVVQGTAFDAGSVALTEQGWWYDPGSLHQINFIQQAIEVEYTEGLRRGPTRSRLDVDGDSVVVGDNVPLNQHGYRFYTTSNKGFAAMINWYAKDGGVARGSINFPSYPLYDWKPHNRWQTPGGEQLEFRLAVDTALDRDRDWLLNNVEQGQLHISLPLGREVTLVPGGQIELNNGVLEFEAIRMWMGYQIFYDPWLAWFFAAAVVGVAGIGWHYYLKLSLPRKKRAVVGACERRNGVVSASRP